MSKTSFLAALVLFATLLAACQDVAGQDISQPFSTPAENALADTFPIDPIFQEFYDYLGGAETLGPAITPLVISGDRKTQYLESGLMVYDPQAPDTDRYRLAPLGLVLGVAEPPVPDPGDPQARYLNGHVIFSGFTAFYEQLGGARFVGKPLTEARYNPEKKRIEQYFENLGFYRLDGEEPGRVRLLAYGAYACDARCRYQAPSASIPSLRPYLPEPFASYAARLGVELAGKTLTEPHRAEDGRLEVIFENVVLVIEEHEAAAQGDAGLGFLLWFPGVVQLAPEEGVNGLLEAVRHWLPLAFQGQPSEHSEEESRSGTTTWLPLVFEREPIIITRVTLRPLADLLQLPHPAPQPCREEALTACIPVDGDLGYHVPRYFLDWIERRGGMEVSGLPVGETLPLAEGVFRQCFTNLCLDFDTRAPAGNQLKPAPMGILYKERFYKEPGEFGKFQELENVRLQVWESKPYVAPDGEQQIHISVTEAGEGLANRELVLTLTAPDNRTLSFDLEPTDENGQTSLRLAPIPAPNGTLIAYQVCLAGIEAEQLCVSDHYLIWK